MEGDGSADGDDQTLLDLSGDGREFEADGAIRPTAISWYVS